MIEVIIGVISGIISGIGMGGGAILIFLLSYTLGVDQLTAQAINLIFFIPTSIVAVIVNIKNKNIEIKEAILISIFGIIGAIIGANLALKIEANLLRKFFGGFLGVIVITETFSIFKYYIKNKNMNIKAENRHNTN